jgi:putative lipoic acid-binding regulatory protein
MKKLIDYPSEITFKSVFMHDARLHEILETILQDNGISGRVTHRSSRNSKFVSYTITAEFISESHLNETCARISAVKGFIMMF